MTVRLVGGLNDEQIGKCVTILRRELRRPGVSVDIRIIPDPPSTPVCEVVVNKGSRRKYYRFMPEIPDCWDKALEDLQGWVDG